MQNFLPRMKQSQGLFSIAVLGAGNVIGTVISAIALILFSRFLGPTEFGIFSAAFAAMQIGVRVADMGLNIAAERSIARVFNSDPTLADKYMRVSFWFKFVLSGIAVILGWILAPWLAHTILHLESVGIIRLALILSAGTVFFEYTTFVFQSSGNFSKVSRITIMQALGKLLFGLLLIWQRSLTAFTGLLLYALMPFVGALSAWGKKPLSTFSLPGTWRRELKVMLGVAKWTSIAAISATLADNIDVLMIQSFLSSYDTGLWSAAVRIATFASVLGWTIGAVLSNRVAKYTNKKHLDDYLSKAWKLSLGAFVLILCAIPFSHLGIWLTVGSAYFPATTALQILLISSALAAAASPFVALFYLFDKPRYYAYTGVLQTLILLVGDYFIIPTLGLTGAAWVRVGVRLFVLVFTLVYARYAYLQKYGKK